MTTAEDYCRRLEEQISDLKSEQARSAAYLHELEARLRESAAALEAAANYGRHLESVAEDARAEIERCGEHIRDLESRLESESATHHESRAAVEAALAKQDELRRIIDTVTRRFQETRTELNHLKAWRRAHEKRFVIRFYRRIQRLLGVLPNTNDEAASGRRSLPENPTSPTQP